MLSQELKVSIDKNPVFTNEVIQLEYLINEKGDNFTPPVLSDFHVLNGPTRGFSQSYSNINGKTTQEIKTNISYSIQAKKEGKYIVGPASLQVNNKTIKSKEIEIVIEKSTNKIEKSSRIFPKSIQNLRKSLQNRAFVVTFSENVDFVKMV